MKTILKKAKSFLVSQSTHYLKTRLIICLILKSYTHLIKIFSPERVDEAPSLQDPISVSVKLFSGFSLVLVTVLISLTSVMVLSSLVSDVLIVFFSKFCSELKFSPFLFFVFLK
jgi:hypothetical protein